MNDQAKMQRLLRLLMLLAGKRWYTREEIKERTGISDRTSYRYFSTLEAAGLVVERSDAGYRLSAEKGAAKTLGRLLHFTEEEAYILYKTLGLLHGEGIAKDRLLRKLHTLYDCHILARPAQQHSMEIVEQLELAINNGTQCLLKEYRSNHSGTITDRLVEPFQFGEAMESIWCYDTLDDACKQFKLARMEAVEVQTQKWQNTGKHQVLFNDAFGFAAAKPIGTAVVWLTLLAANLLREEYPLAEPYISSAETGYYVHLPVASWKGIGRFVKGLEGEVVVGGPKSFKKFLGW